MKPLRVLHIIESLGRGGAERQLANLLLAHDRGAIRPSVVALNPPPDLAADPRNHRRHRPWIAGPGAGSPGVGAGPDHAA